MDPMLSGWDPKPGLPVYDANGRKLGTIAEVTPTHLVIESGFLFRRRFYMPRGAAGELGDDRVTFNISHEDIELKGWGKKPF